MVLEGMYKDKLIRVGDEITIKGHGKAYITKIKLSKDNIVSDVFAISENLTSTYIVIDNFELTGKSSKNLLKFAEELAGIDY